MLDHTIWRCPCSISEVHFEMTFEITTLWYDIPVSKESNRFHFQIYTHLYLAMRLYLLFFWALKCHFDKAFLKIWQSTAIQYAMCYSLAHLQSLFWLLNDIHWKFEMKSSSFRKSFSYHTAMFCTNQPPLKRLQSKQRAFSSCLII